MGVCFFVGWLAGWLAAWLPGWLPVCMLACLSSWLVVALAPWLAVCLAGWLVGLLSWDKISASYLGTHSRLLLREGLTPIKKPALQRSLGGFAISALLAFISDN